MFFCINKCHIGFGKNGQATRIFTNTVTSQYNSGTTGGSVSLGAVAGAFGVSGICNFRAISRVKILVIAQK